MSTTKKLNLIFDFDGTLVDSFDMVIEKFNVMADTFNFRKLDHDQIHELKNLTSKELIKSLKIPLYRLPGIMRHAREFMRKEMPVLGTFIGLPEVLNELHQLDCTLGIITSNSAENVASWLEHHKVDHLFHFVRAESSYFGKHHVLKKIIKSHQLDSARTFYIGDETRDLEAAQKCKVRSIAVAWGFNSEETLVRYKPDHLARAPQDIIKIISNSLS